ncbi:autotransporter domain-containing protein [Halomonas sp. WWR20]
MKHSVRTVQHWFGQPVRCLSRLVALGVFVASAPASAYSQLVVFGDSLSDSGQFPDPQSLLLGEVAGLRFTNRLGPRYQAPSPYGEVMTQRLAQALGLGPLLPSTSIIRDQIGLPDGTNYATGGYTTAQILASITQPQGSVVSAAGVSRTRDGYLVANDSADPEALYYLNGGGNDFLQGLVTGPASAVNSAYTLASAVDALVAAGARTLVVSNLPDVGLTPAGLLSGQRAGFSALDDVFNQALGTRLARYDGDVDIIRLDVGGLVSEVLTAPADFGFATDVALTDVCFSDALCDTSAYGLASGSPDPAKLFYNDTVHPTTAAQQIFADYAQALIEAPRIVSLAGELATGALNAQQQVVSDELRPGVQRDALRIFVHGDYRHTDTDEFYGQGASDMTQRGGSVGAVLPLGLGWAGIAVGQRYAEIDEPGDIELDGQAFSLFARQHIGRVGLQLVASYGDFDLDLHRHVTLGTAERVLSGATDADGWAAEARLDYRLTSADSPWYTAPFVGYRHAQADIGAYQESGSSANALTVSKQQHKDRRLELGLMMDRALQNGYGVFGEFAWGEYLEDSRDGASVMLTSLPTNHWSGERQSREDDHYLRVDTGWRMALGRSAMLEAGVGAEGWDDMTAHFRLGASLTF